VSKQQSLWLSAAIITGLSVATLPIAIVIMGGVVVFFVLLSALTPLAALMFLLVLAPLRTLIATEAAFQLPLDIGQIGLMGFLSAWALHSFVLRRTRLHWSAIYIPLIVFLIGAGLSAFTALSISAWINEWLKWLQMLALAVIVIHLLSGQRWQWLVGGLMIAGVANALIGLYEFFGGSGALHLLINDRFFRAFGTFGQPNPFGGFMGLLAPIAVMTTLGYAIRFWKSRRNLDFGLLLFYLSASLLLFAGIIISWSRGAWLGVVVSLTVMFMALPRKTIRGVGLSCASILLISILWMTGALPQSVVARISSSTEEFFAFEDVRGVDISPENYPVVERLAHWQAALNMTRANPWLGVGLGSYEVAYPDYRLINWDEPLGHAHNYYLNILAEGGIIGLVAYGSVWFLIIWINWQARKHPDMLSRLTATGILGTWAYLSVHSLFDNLYVNNLFLHIGMILGILGVLYNQVVGNVKLRV
jgi:putative inorganic carbon (HCO3(-)) transporter